MKLLFVSLGCDKNLVDSEYMIGMLTSHGIELTDDETEADIIIVNSCCFIGDAKEESINTILEMAEQKKTGCCKSLIVTGCLTQRYQDEVKKEIPEVDAILGTNSYDSIVEALEETLQHKFYKNFHTLSGLPQLSTKRTVPMDELVTSAEELVAGGVKELILVAQETTLYGVDLYGKKCLHELLDRLNGISGLFWIRIMYCYPEEIYEELIDSMIKDKKVCHYLDMPIQHCNDTILQRMGRKTNKKELIERIHYLRKRVPDITLRTSLICGFPGETKEQHEELMQFVNDMEFDRLGAFTYSAEEGTPAAEMPDQVPQEQKEEWQADVMELQEEVIFDKNEAMKDTVLYAFIEGQVADENNTYVGRTYRDAPNVDGYIFINTDEELLTGDIVKVEVTGAYEYDLIATIVK